MADAAYQAKYLSVARLLWDSVNGNPGDIPSDYCEHLSHEYLDGDVSFGPLISKLDYTEHLEGWEIEEAIEMLGKVSPSDWPDPKDIESISAEALLHDFTEFDFVEDNLSTAEMAEQVLSEVISSVFGDKVSEIRSEKGFFPNHKNSFLQEEDGTFAGTFKHDGKKFAFEVFPDEQGWTVTYRMSAEDLDKLPEMSHQDDEKKSDYTRQVRHRGWK